MQIGIIGAGMAGLCAADLLVGQGHTVTLFDKGRAAGGRLSTRRVDDGHWQFDHGAPWFSARDEGFIAAMTQWEKRGVVARWPNPDGQHWVGVPGMNALVRHVAEGHDVRFGVQITSLLHAGDWWLNAGDKPYGPFDAILLALPAEQAALLAGLYDFNMARVAASVRSVPVWTGMFAFDRILAAPDVISAKGGIDLALRNGAKPGRGGGETWVVHATSQWSAQHLEDAAEDVAGALLSQFGDMVDDALPKPVFMQAHRWRFALPSDNPASTQFALWNPQIQLGACGDWLGGNGVEAAWLSGRALATRMLEGWRKGA